MDKAIVFSINNDYSFALANVLMSLKDNSEYIYNTSDFIIYHDGVSDNNQQLLKKICKNIYFIDFTKESSLPELLYNHRHRNSRWGQFICQKLNCFELVSRYEHVLWLDTDILVNGDISYIFNSNADIAYRNVIAYKHRDIYNDKKDIPDFPCCHGGVVCFNKSLAHRISHKDFIEAYNATNNGKAGIDEKIITYIAFSKKLNIKVLPMEYNAWPACINIDEAKIIHFMESTFKPWENSVVYAAFPEWGYHYRQWIKMGGTGPLTKHDKFYSRGYTFGFLRNTLIFTRIIKNLDIMKNPYIYTNFDFSKPFYQFYINNIPECIHYEILNVENSFKICLHIENKQFINNSTILIFEEFRNNINKIFTEISLNKDNFLKLEITAPEKLINFTMNHLVKQTIDKMLHHFSAKK